MKSNLIRILNVAEFFTFSKAYHGTILSKALLKPKIIPPFHCDQVSEPHVRKFMHSNLIPLHEFKEGLFLLWPHKGVPHNNYANVFHTVDSKFRHEDHVILLERERASEILLEKVDGNLDSAESFLWLRQFSFRFPAINLHRYFVTSLIGDTAVGSYSQGIDISADRWTGVKLVNVAALSKVHVV